MQSRIDQMLSAWNQLELLKSVRTQRPQPLHSKQAEVLPLPIVESILPMPLAGVVRTARVVNHDSSQSSSESASNSGLASTPPRLTSDRVMKISASDINLPELPDHLANADISGSRTPSPPASPRVQEATTSNRSSHVKQLRKKASKRLSQFKIDLSELAQKMSPRSERSSPEKSSPIRKASPRKDDPRLAGLSLAVRHRIATEMAEFCLSDDYKKSSETRQSMLFNGKLIGFLDSYPDLVNTEALKALRTDLEWRMTHACIDTVVDLADERFFASVKKELEGRFMQTWGNEKAGEEGERHYPEAKGKMTKTFLRDFPMTSHVLKFDDGRLEKIDHPATLMDFIGAGQGGNLPYLVSHVANQNLTTFLNTVLFRRASEDGKFDSVLRLWDGSPVTPRGNMRSSATYSKDSAGNIILEHEYFCSKLTSPTNLGLAPANDSFNKKSAHDHAELTVKVRVKFAPDGEWKIENPQVLAKGWNVPAED